MGAEQINMSDAVQKIVKGNKAVGIIVAIVMIIMGILFFVMPLRTTIVVEIFAAIGVLVFGLFQILAYARIPKEERYAGTLTSGIIFVLVGVIILLSSATGVVVSFAFLLGFLSIFRGFNQTGLSAQLKAAGAPRSGWVFASGIISVILGVFLIVAPFAATFLLGFILGIYLIVGAIALFIEIGSGRSGLIG